MRGLCAAIFGCLAIALIASTGCKKSACTTSSDCSSGEGCYFPVGDCAAEGVCIDPTGKPACTHVDSLCGCDGKIVSVYCGDPDGYASAPTVSATFDPTAAESNSGTCDVDQDAGGVDAAIEQ